MYILKHVGLVSGRVYNTLREYCALLESWNLRFNSLAFDTVYYNRHIPMFQKALLSQSTEYIIICNSNSSEGYSECLSGVYLFQLKSRYKPKQKFARIILRKFGENSSRKTASYYILLLTVGQECNQLCLCKFYTNMIPSTWTRKEVEAERVRWNVYCRVQHSITLNFNIKILYIIDRGFWQDEQLACSVLICTT